MLTEITIENGVFTTLESKINHYLPNEKGEVVYPPAYLSEEEVLQLVKEGYTLCGVGEFPIAEKVQVRSVDPVKGLEKAVCRLAEKGAFGELTALYVRKSSAELNLGK